MNIIWKKPDLQISITSIVDNSVSPQEYAIKLQVEGNVNTDWIAVAYNYYDIPETSQDLWRWENDKIITIPYIPTAEENKATASSLLSETDWVNQPDVTDPINSPYLANQSEFIAYRNLVRQIAVYPTAGNLVWPIKPNEVWR